MLLTGGAPVDGKRIVTSDMRIHFVRHGESQANVRREIANRGLKHPLTRQGRAQARALAAALRAHPIARVYSSPLLRALETSVVVAHALDVPLEVSEALREYDLGRLEGRSDEAAWREWKCVFEAWTRLGEHDRHAEGGERFAEVRARFVPFVDTLVARHAGDDEVVCVAHGGLYWTMLPLVLVDVDFEHVAARGGFGHAAHVVAEARHEGLVVVAWEAITAAI